MEPPSLSELPGYALGLFVALTIGGEVAAKVTDAVLSILSGVPAALIAAIGGDPASLAKVALLVLAAGILYIATPSRLDFFRMFRPD